MWLVVCDGGVVDGLCEVEAVISAGGDAELGARPGTSALRTRLEMRLFNTISIRNTKSH